VAQEATTPLRRWENSLELPVALLILPLFAFLNAGVEITAQSLQYALRDPVAWGIVVGLTLGKPVGLILGVRLSEWAGLAARSPALSDARLLGIGLLAGVGFTMSTFIAHLALAGAPEALAAAKLAIVAASALAAIGGYLLLRRAGAVDDSIADR
jgi:NhaA family Na+:H+ antiporter